MCVCVCVLYVCVLYLCGWVASLCVYVPTDMDYYSVCGVCHAVHVFVCARVIQNDSSGSSATTPSFQLMIP